jgi:hypothetical protein
MNKFIAGFIAGVILSVGGTALGAMQLNFAGAKQLTIQEQINKGHIFDQYTGKRLQIELSETELRFRAIEARLEALEKAQ